MEPPDPTRIPGMIVINEHDLLGTEGRLGDVCGE